MKKNYFVILLSLILFSTQIFAQPKKKIKFGKVSKEDLEMTVYDKDSSAVAVILSDVGCWYLSAFKRHIRIKILKDEGKKWADRKIYGRVITLKGFTFTLENGKIKKTKLKNSMIFNDELVSGIKRKTLSMPDVQVGSIIDIKYELNNIPSSWQFQKSIPTIYSKLTTEIPTRYVDFLVNHKGFYRVNKKLETGQNGSEKTIYWMENIPAMKPEPFMNSPKNYISELNFELRSVGSSYYTTDWKHISKKLLESKYFGKRLRNTHFIKKILPKIIGDAKTNMEKVECIFNYVKNRMTWNKKQGIYCKDNLKKVYERKTGSASEINLLLLAILKEAGISARPVVLSTRDNGMLPLTHASIDKLNYVIPIVINDGKKIFLDATDKNAQINLLPIKCLNGKARIIDEHFSKWVDLTPKNYSLRNNSYFIKIKEDGSIEGQNRTIISGNSFFYHLEEKGELAKDEDFVKNKEEEIDGLDILELKTDSLNPMKYTQKFTLENAVSTAGDLMYLKPMLFEAETENTFKQEKRLYPIDFIFPLKENIVMSYEIPKDYEVEELPKSTTFQTQDNGLSYSYSINKMGNRISLMSTFCISKVIFLPKEYQNVKDFFAQMIAKQAENIVLKKIAK